MSAIAIIGMGARFAGAWDLVAYWDMLRAGRDAFGPVPPDRWPAEAFLTDNRRATDKTYAPHGAFIQDIRSFPALALGLPPRRVEVMDPQQRLAIEVALQAIEDAGYRASELPRRTGVYVGITAHEYRSLNAVRISAMMMAAGAYGRAPDDPSSIVEAVENIAPSRPYAAPGGLGNMAAASVAQELDLHGPAYTTDAACASAHMAIYDAVHQLRSGAIDAALAGGSYVQVTPDHYVVFARIGAMSASGYCRPFDHRADGFVQGDGAGLMLLKRLEDAVRDGDRIYGVIEGVAINNDGRGDGPMAPLQAGQTEVINQAWEDSGLDKSQLGYHEAHGTGTPVGDPTEMSGLAAAVADHVTERVALGSAKGNIGHTMSAAGVAGMIRATLAVHHGVIPPMAGYESPNPRLDLEHLPFRVPTAAEPWTARTRIAGCSAFGFGGTNGHILVRSWEGARRPSPSLTRADAREAAEAELDSGAELVLMSAPTLQSLRDLAGRTADAIGVHADATVAGVARAWSKRQRQPARLGVVASTVAELVDKLRAVAADELPRGVKIGVVEHHTAPTLAFLYPGQGAQRVGMLRDTKERFPIVADTLDAIEAALDDALELPLTELIYPELRDEPVDAETAEAQLTATQNCQPAMLAAGVALTALLDQVGIRPSVVVGHSLGEFTAAAVGGAISATDAARFVAARGRAMADLDGDHGTMAAVMAGREAVEALLVEGAVIANVNHPRQLVVSGFTEAVDQVVQNAASADLKAVPLAVSHGFHSPALAHLDSAPLLEGITLSVPDITVASGIDDHPYASIDDVRGVFLRHATSPVEFVRALDQCRQAGADLYLQVGAAGPLAAFARGSLPRDHRGIVTLAGKDDADGGRTVLESLAQLWCLGVEMDLTAITAEAPLPSLPPSMLPREKYWSIKDEPQLPIEVEGFRPTPRAPVAAVAAQATAPQAEQKGSDDPLADKVIGIIAKVSAYPRSALRPEMALVEDLGFDSLMVGDLATGLSEAFANIDGIPQELLINRPTVADMIDFARTAGTGPAVVHDDDAPLTAYAVQWQTQPLPDLPGRDLLAGHRVLVVGPESVAAAFAQAGAKVTHTTAAEATIAPHTDLIVWADLDEQPAPQMVMSDGLPVPDRVSAFIAALARQAPSTPDVLVISADGDPWSAGLHGVVRGLPREWPGSSATSLHLDPAALATAGELALAQWTSADRTADVRHAAGQRQILAFVAQDPTADAEWSPSPDDVVLITGGTRGIGLELARQLLAHDAQVVLLGRSAPGAEAQTVLEEHAGRAVAVQADVTDRDGLATALAGRGITAIVHAAGLLADGALEEVDPEVGQRALRVKIDGVLNAVHAARASRDDSSPPAVVLGIGSWAGRFGNRHQAWYGAANAQLVAVLDALETRGVTAEFGPWTGSEMVQSIPAPVQSAMRAEGIDFVGPQAGQQALLQSLTRGSGAWTFGRDLPASTRAVHTTLSLSTQTHPYLLDHAIEGTPVLPLAGATDLLAWASGLPAPFAVTDVRLFQGVTVKEPVELLLTARGDRAELRFADRGALAYRARVRAVPPESVTDPGAASGGEAPELSLADFYDITFHGPLLAGITSIDGVGDDFVRGRVRVGSPADWIPSTQRGHWAVDPLVLDSAMQLSAYVAWVRYRRAGTPVALGRYVQLAPFPAQGEVVAEVSFGPIEGDRFTGTLRLRDADTGALLAVAEDVVAELRKAEDAVEAAEEPFEVKPEWVDFGQWKEVNDLEMRLMMAEMGGIENPFFRVQEGTARDTTMMGGKEYINFSSYNYIGLSGDPRVLDKVKEAVDLYGTSVSASRVASGERPFHGELEKMLAAAQRKQDSLVFTAGHATNVTTIGHLFGPEDLIIHDEYIHDSGLQGIKLSGAARRGFAHDDPEACDHELKRLRRHYKRVLILVEGVYSMDGDICALPEYVRLKREHGCLLMVDEAHSFGVVGETGQGCAEHYDLDPEDVDLWMGTLSKSLASCGGWISGSDRLIQYLRYTAPGFVYSAGLTAANGVAAVESLRLMNEEPWRVKKLQDNAHFFQAKLSERGIDTGPAKGESGVVPAITGNSMWALQLAQRLNHVGINVQPIVYPAVPDDASRLRFFLSSTHSFEQLEHTATMVADILEQVHKDFPLP